MKHHFLKHASRWSLGRLRDATGATLVEAAIITPFLLILTFAIVDFGSMLYVYLALESGVSQATRFAITGNQMQDPGNPGSQMSRVDSIKTAMREATPNLTITDSAFTFSHMAVGGSGWVAGTGGPNEIEKVSVNYTWNLLTPVLRPFFSNGQITFTVESAMKNEGRWE